MGEVYNNEYRLLHVLLQYCLVLGEGFSSLRIKVVTLK